MGFFCSRGSISSKARLLRSQLLYVSKTQFLRLGFQVSEKAISVAVVKHNKYMSVCTVVGKEIEKLFRNFYNFSNSEVPML